MAQDGSTAGRQLPITACTPEQEPGDQHCQDPLPHVADERDDTGGFAGHPEDVGKSDVAAASVAGVDPAQRTSREDADGNGSQEIADHERYSKVPVHQEERECVPLRGRTDATNCRTYWAADTSERTNDASRMAVPQ